jgi:hypothetical protein
MERLIQDAKTDLNDARQTPAYLICSRDWILVRVGPIL